MIQRKPVKQTEGSPLDGKLVRIDGTQLTGFTKKDTSDAVEYLRRGIHIAIPNNWVLRTRLLQEVDESFVDVCGDKK